MRRVDKASHGGYQLVCDGVSELVREQEAIFLSSLEEIEFLDPAETRLTLDSSSSFVDSRLYIESQLRATVPNDDRIHVGHQAAMDLVAAKLLAKRSAAIRNRLSAYANPANARRLSLPAGVRSPLWRRSSRLALSALTRLSFIMELSPSWSLNHSVTSDQRQSR